MLTSSLLRFSSSPSSLPPQPTRPLWSRSAALESESTAITLRASTFRPSSVEMSPLAALSLRSLLRSTSRSTDTLDTPIGLSAEVLVAGEQGQQRVVLRILSAARRTRSEAEDDEDDNASTAHDGVEQLSVPLYCRNWSDADCLRPADYSAELERLTRRMDRHRLQPGLQHYLRTFATLRPISSQPSQPLLHVECLSPSLSLRLTPLLPDAIVLQPSSVLHSLLSHEPPPRSCAASAHSASAQSGYLSLTAEQQVRLVSLPSDVLSLPLLGVYCTAAPDSLCSFVQCVHFLYSQAISRLTVAPLTFLLLSLHNARVVLYEVSAVMEPVAIEHCEANIALSSGLPQQLAAPLRPLSAARWQQLWAAMDGTNGECCSSDQPLLTASTATTESSSTAADSASRTQYDGRDASSWLGVYSDGENELGDENWPSSPHSTHSLRSPSPLLVSPPKPQLQRAPDVSAARTSRSALHSLSYNKVAARSAAAAAEHLSRAKSALASRSDAQTKVDTKKCQLQAISARLREKRRTGVGTRKRRSTAGVKAAESTTPAFVSSSQTQHRSEEQSSHDEVSTRDGQQHCATLHVSHTQSPKEAAVAPLQRTGNSCQSRPPPSSSHSPLTCDPRVETRPSTFVRRTAARDAVVRLDDTRSECETEERRKEIDRQRAERVQRRQQRERATRHSHVQHATSSHATSLTPHDIAPPPVTPPITVASGHQPAALLPPVASLGPLELLSALLSSIHSTAPAPHPASAVQPPLSATLQLLQLIVLAAGRGQQQQRPVQATEQAVRMKAIERPQQQPEQATGAPLAAASRWPLSSSSELRGDGVVDSQWAAPQQASVSAEARQMPAEWSEGNMQHSEATHGEVTLATTQTHSPLSPQSTTAAQRKIEEMESEVRSSLDSEEAATTTGDEAHPDRVKQAEEKYPLSPPSPPAAAQPASTRATDAERSLSPLQLHLSAASTRSPSPTTTHSSLPVPSDSEATEEGSSDEWPPSSMSLSLLTSPLPLSSSSAPMSAVLCSLDALSIPRINAAGVASRARCQSLHPHSDEDEDDEEETLLNKYDHERSRHQRHRGRGRG